MSWQLQLKKNIPEILAGLFVLGGIIAFIRQFFLSDSAHFCPNQFFTHETFVVACVIGAIALIAGKYLTRLSGTIVTTRIPEILAACLLVIAVLAIFHQRFFTDDGWFHIGQATNYETIIGGCIAGVAGLLIGKYIKKQPDG